MPIGSFIRKIGRTAQVHFPGLQEAGKAAEAGLRNWTGSVHDADLNGLRNIGVPSQALFLDIGANRGEAAKSIWSLCPDTRLIGFEPNPAMVDRFGHIFSKRGGKVYAVALSNQVGEFPLYIPVYRGVVFDGLASLSEANAREWLNRDTLFGFNPRKLEIRKFSCQVATLDQFGLSPFFIKIDVQGREYEVLEGALKTIAASRPIIFAESETLDIPRVLTLLSPWHYEVFRFDDGGFHSGEVSLRNVYLFPADKRTLLRAAS